MFLSFLVSPNYYEKQKPVSLLSTEKSKIKFQIYTMINGVCEPIA